uniref:HDC02356 n=1 Tax=Drosophila melanogaster TaxID=7227 RepID=Q6IHK4_DROME|nr:TPA_inf: HDC02356 [Drosophila melanogaster]
MVGTTSLSGLISCHLCWSHRHNRKPPVSSSNTFTSTGGASKQASTFIPPSSLMFRTHSVRTPECGNCSVDYVIRQATRSYCAPPYLLYRHNACLICRIANIAGNTKRSTMWHMRR